MSRIKGIDVSQWRGYVNWHSVARDPGKIHFAITKATDGIDYLDPTFDVNWIGMRRVNLIRGAFHFFRPAAEPLDQADFFLEIMQGIYHPFDLPLILDVERGRQGGPLRAQWEALSLQERMRRLRSCLERIEAGSGRLPFVYTNESTWKEMLADTEELAHYPLWVANYEVEIPNLPANDWGGEGYWIWQFSEDGVVEGVNYGEPPVDLNWFQGRSEALGPLEEMQAVFGMDPPPPPSEEYFNQDILDAFRHAAGQEDQVFRQLLSRAELFHLFWVPRNRGRPYGGLPIEDLPNLSDEVRIALAEFLRDRVRTPTNLGIPGLSNQDVINVFIRAAARTGESGLSWLSRAGLSEIAQAREQPYRGPTLEEMIGLNETEIIAIRIILGLGEIIEPDEPIPTYPELELTNQGMINAFYIAAARLNQGGWSWIQRVFLTHMANPEANRFEPYTGPLVEDLPGLTTQEKSTLLDVLDLPIDMDGTDPTLPTYPGVINQDMINALYRAAGQFNQTGWSWVQNLGFANLAIPNSNRGLLYTGPRVEDLPNLTPPQMSVLRQEIHSLIQPDP